MYLFSMYSRCVFIYIYNPYDYFVCITDTTGHTSFFTTIFYVCKYAVCKTVLCLSIVPVRILFVFISDYVVAMISRLLENSRSLLQNIVSFIGLFCKRDLSF